MVLKTEEIVGEYMKRTSESKKMFDKASQLIPGAVGSAIRFIRPYPFFIKRAKGSKIWDVDGNEYIDYCLAYGPLVTGHAHPKIVEAVKEQAEDGLMYGYPHEKTALLIEELKRRYPMTNMWRLANSGTEATMHAIRLARGVTRKDKIVKIEGNYHGCHDAVLVSIAPYPFQAGPRWAPTSVVGGEGILKGTADATVIVPFNDIEVMENIFKKHEGEIAGVITEPVMCNCGVILPKENYLRDLRKLTREYNILLIFDEVKTGLRIAPGGACEYYKVDPDIVVLGKAVGGGGSLAAFGAKRGIMNQLTPTGLIPHFGTYNANPLAVAAGLTSLTEVMTANAYDHLWKVSEQLLRGEQDIIEDAGVKVVVTRIKSILGHFHGLDTPPVDYRTARDELDTRMWYAWFISMINNGVAPQTGGAPMQNSFVSIAHTEEDIEKTLEANKKVYSAMKD